MPVIEIKNLSFVYGKGTVFENKAIDNISLSIDKGDFIGIIGHTGSGKSTLIQHLNGLLKPESGNIIVDGKDIWENANEIRKVRYKVGMAFQYPEHQLFEETVFKDISFGPRNMGLSDEEVKKRVYDAAKFVELSERLLNKSPFELSGGEKRRAAIAGVMAMDPQVLILDEPTAGLDPKGRDVLLAQIKNYHKIKGNTVLLVSHSMEDVAKNANKVLVMNKGKVAMFDKTRVVFEKSEQLKEMGLQVPQITRIMTNLKAKGYQIPGGILTVEEAINALKHLLCERREYID